VGQTVSGDHPALAERLVRVRAVPGLRSLLQNGVGAAGYDPRMLLGLLMYGYCRGVRSSRQIERLCGTDVAFRVLCAQDVPDHCTLARFRADCQDGFTSLFTQVLMIAGRAGMARFGTVAIDGTKIAANASIDANRPSLNDLGHLCRHGASSAAWTVGASPWRLPLPDTGSPSWFLHLGTLSSHGRRGATVDGADPSGEELAAKMAAALDVAVEITASGKVIGTAAEEGCRG
jgi:transposase